MQGPGGGPRPSPVRKGSGTSCGSQRRASIISGIYANRARSRRQSTASDGKAAYRASLAANKIAVQVFDDEGKDVTPHPLFHSDPHTVVARQSKLLASSAYFGATGSISLSPFSMHQTPGVNASLGSLSRTYGSSSTSLSNASTTESIPDETLEPGSQQDTTVSLSGVQVRQEEVKEELTTDDLDRRVDIYLSETETIWILEMLPAVVSVESEAAGRVRERNRIYADICKTRPGNDRFVEKMMQTLNGAAKNKEVQCDKIIMEEKGSTTTPTVISESAVLARIHEEKQCHSEAILRSENFQQDLFFMERILTENIFQPKLAAYRQFPVLIDPDVTSDTSGTAAAVKKAKQGRHDKGKKEKEEQKEAFVDPSILSDLNKTPEETVPPRLERLWSYICDLTNGHSVSSMAWSKLNPDLLAVGYGAFDFKEQKEGLACCWSLKNPMWPERIFRCEHGVTALDFSVASPNLLAVGMYDGSVAVYDVRSCKDDALLDSSESSNKHTGPVWQLRWVEQDRDATEDSKKEILICISADGQVTEWLIQKRLDCTDLMKIKRRESEKKKLPGRKERKCEVLVSQQAAGMCFDFHPKDTNYYLVGTEEGHIHKCSCSCNEQFLETYRGHKGPVHKVTWHPFSTDVFLSCSADWSIILWRQDSQTPVLTFTSTTAFVHDVMWSPKSAFIFAAAKESRVEIWDLSVSIFYPVISCFASPQGKFTSVLFAKNTDCLLAGDSEGEVSVFELQNLPAPYSNKVESDTIP
ncbi:dynein axonemal intermediate chain 4 isoform X2 [Nyctibius grandis]|uniref:dynein axonemal intermediate chain 4 isoform X2 n=1 Tax=Nyctibius grandis TaxID=48427 RepID=UPI0035BC908C